MLSLNEAFILLYWALGVAFGITIEQVLRGRDEIH